MAASPRSRPAFSLSIHLKTSASLRLSMTSDICMTRISTTGGIIIMVRVLGGSSAGASLRHRTANYPTLQGSPVQADLASCALLHVHSKHLHLAIEVRTMHPQCF